MWLGLFFLALAVIPIAIARYFYLTLRDPNERYVVGFTNRALCAAAIAFCALAGAMMLAASFMAFTGLGT